MSDAENKTAFKCSRFCRWIFSLFCLLLLHAQGLRGQITEGYFDTGLSVHYFKASSLQEVEPFYFGPLLRFGFSVYHTPNKQFTFYMEGRFNFRRFERSFDSEEFAYRIYAFELPAYAAWNASEKWQLHIGINPMFYGVSLKSEPDNTAVAYTGKGFRNFDISTLVGLRMRLGGMFSLGIRGELGLIPMVKYTPIGDFGEFGPRQTDMLYRRTELFLRWHII
jgi:hypothetical protein